MHQFGKRIKGPHVTPLYSFPYFEGLVITTFLKLNVLVIILLKFSYATRSYTISIMLTC